MSLTTFHAVFITLAAALAVGFAAWAWGMYHTSGAVAYVATSTASLCASASLVTYEVMFFRRCRRLGLS